MLFACATSTTRSDRADGGGPAGAGDAAADASDAGLTTVQCDDARLAGADCVAGACSLGATGAPLPPGKSLTLSAEPLPPDLNGDAIGPVLCSITLPDGVASVSDLDLTITLAAPAPARGALFERLSSVSSRLVTTSQPAGSAVHGLVSAPGEFGATEAPATWSVESQTAIDVASSADLASLLKNLSSQTMSGAFYDGTHLFVCNGPRLLVYDGVPASPAVKPSLVLGQADLDTTSSETTSSLFGRTGCMGVWSDGRRLVVAQGNRILVWNAMPTENAAPADLVLGQPDFSSNMANAGGVTAASLWDVSSVDSDGTRLTAAEIENNRVLVWNTFPVRVDQPADFVIGQPDFTSNAVSNGATSIYQAWGSVFVPDGMFVTGEFDPGLVHLPPVAASNPAPDFVALPTSFKLQPPSVVVDAAQLARIPGGGLAVRDADLERIAVFKKAPTSMSAASLAPTIDFVLGQPDVSAVVSSPVSASVVATSGAGSALGGGGLVLVPDRNRLLVYDTTPTFNFEPASRVVGQAGFTTNGTVDYRGISASTLAGPADVAFGSGFVAIADRGNNRVVLVRPSDVLTSNFASPIVLGQPDGGSYVPNVDQQTPSAATMSGPAGVALDGRHLIVADTENHRVLIWNTVPTKTGTAADLVLGQADFTGRRPNRGRGDANGDGLSDAAADGFFYPTGVASNGTQLFVADRVNNRVLVWNTFPTANGQAADAVLGQPDFTTSRSNRGNGPFTIVPDGLNLPTGVAVVGTSLWVADTENNRLVRWDDATTAPTPGPVVGQSTPSAVANPNYEPPTAVNVAFAQQPATSASSVLRPRGVAVVGGTLYVTESDSNRVHLFDAASLAPKGELGQSTDTGASANAAGVTASSLWTPMGVASDGATLWVADSGNHRVLGFDVTAPPATGTPATSVLGQPGFSTNGFDQASAAAGGVTSLPGGLALEGGNLYVADTGNNRVLVLPTPVGPGEAPSRVYGQPDMLQALPNAGGAPSATTLSAPRGVFVDQKHLIVADTGNNRVVVYDPNASTAAAVLVLGQAGFTTAAANPGGPSAGTMQAPAAVFSDGTSLWVADTGNHRVLVWRSFPTSNGQPADLVLGQTSFAGALPNQGGAAATPSSLSFPSSVDVIAGVLYVADTGNNRVVSFSTPPAVSGASADGVLGQADLSSRIAAVGPGDMNHLAGPVALADDGENLYVVDRDLGRVQVFALGVLSNGVVASASVGSSGGLTLRAPEAVAVERTPFFTSRLYVGDTGGNDVEVVQSVSRLTP